ncbi:putative dienelactone hydrolase [hydrothermal vent metagenome]|uniref:Putative dienelactone hydrolase n=1 Tax=hydrothermal vent metagenome TaxID=652676 RepID=A0A3B0YVS3_9ZZZZ
MKKPSCILTITLLLIASVGYAADKENKENKKNKASKTTKEVISKRANQQWWWDNLWWTQGHIKTPDNYTVSISNINFKSRGNTIPAMLIRPKKKGSYYPVLFVHGRRGLGALVSKHAIRLAARGFVVLAADIYKGNYIDPFPMAHDYKLEQDVNKALSVLLKQKNIKSKKACIYSHTRGGYYSLKVAVTFKRQLKSLACFVSYYPHLQDPNAPEPLQVYGYAPEVNKLELPTLIFIGENEQYQRRRVIESSVKAMQDLNRSVRLIIYPGVGRAFDFRPPNVRTFADDLAAKDAIQRATQFMRMNLNNK